MATKTNLNSAPYFDDFNEKKNFHKVLFKPGMAVQARELTQMQTILQNQIERFGNNILREGTIISGCNFVEILDMGHVKVGDLETSGVPVAMNAYRGALAVGTVSGVEAEIQEVEVGYESQAPDLNTLYVKYIKVGNTYSSGGRTLNYKKFLANENIEVRMKSTRDLIGTLTGKGVGNSYAVRVTDGVIFQKGFFVRVDPQITIVSKYDNVPDNVVVGFQTNEELVTSYQDTTLLDNATGSNNENAPGADRLKLIPVLVRKTLEEANDDDRFFAIQEYQNGKVVRRNRETQYAGIMSQIEQRTKEESGNYTLSDFPLSISSTGDPDYLSVNIGRGTAYVEGKRVQLLNTYDIMIDTATDFKKESSQSIATNYGNYILLTDFMGDFDFSTAQSVRFYNAPQDAATNGAIPAPTPTGTLIGTANARSFVLDSGVAGTPTAIYRLYIFDINMNSGRSFSEVNSVYAVETSGGLAAAGDLVSTTIYENKFDKMIFPIGRSSIKSVPAPGTSVDYVMRASNRDLTVQTNGSMTIALSEGEWAYTGSLNSTQLREIILIPKSTNGANYVTGRPLDMTNASATVSGNTLTITGLPVVGASIPVIGYFNVKINATQPTAKEIGTYYTRIDPATHSAGVNGPWSLGVPDVYSIENVYIGGAYNETAANDRTSYFALDTGQKDSHYGLASIKKAKPINLTGKFIVVKFKAFKRNISGVYADAFFTVNSYPVDDSVVSATTIKTQDIPVYVSDDGKRYNLRDSIDFRPYANATSPYNTTMATGTVNPAAIENFSGSRMFPAPNKEFETDYEYYLARKDLLVLNEEGKFEIISGTPSVNAVPPAEPNKGMVLATINLPPYPSLEKREADMIGKSEMGVTMIRKNQRRYTMKDIGGLDQRLTNMEYYTTLSALETSTKDMVVADASGNNRFKNGIFADSFEDLAAASVNSSEFAAAIDPAFNELTPKFRSYPLDLRISNFTNCKDYGEVLTLAKDSEVAFIKQPYATNYRNCVTDFWKFNGTMSITPKYDSAHDTNEAPNININVDMTTPFVDFTRNLNHIVPLNRTSSTTASTVRTTQTANTTARVSTSTTTSTTNSTTNNLRWQGKTTVQEVGDYVTDIRFSPYLRSRNVNILVTGLRPNTVHYFYFDGIDVTNHVAPAKISNGTWVKTGSNGTPVVSGAHGVVRAIFLIPPATFFVGDRVLTINDIDDMDNVDASVSSASATYSGFNFSTTKQGISVTTRAPDFSISSSSSSSTTTTTTSIVNPIPRPVVPAPVPSPTNPTGNTTPTVTIRPGLSWSGIGGGIGNDADPIAQTFKISKNHSSDDVVMVDRLDLFFKDKHMTYGVTIQIRECENGYPGKKILTFGQKHLTSAEVNISNTGLISTSVVFDAPVVMKTGMEYCFVIIPDANNPDYLTWISRTGEKDVFTGQAVNQDSNSGTLFTSTNNSAWTANQDENIKYTLYKNVYREKTGVVYLTNKENEFLTYTPTAGTFRVGEQVGLLAANATGSATTTLGDSTVTGTGFNIFSPGEWIGIYQSPTDIELYKIQTVSSSTSIEIVGSPKATGSGLNYFRTVVGEVTFNNKNTPAKLHLENSSAKSGLLFTEGSTIVGEISGAKAVIDSVDDLDISYLQPNIYKNLFTNTKMALYSDRLTDKVTRTVYAEDTYIPFNTETYLTQKNTVIKSRSKEIQEGTGKSFRLRLDMLNTNGSETNSATPFLDYAISNFMVYTYEINNILTDADGDERTGNGPAKSKYVSKPINLASGFEAEDLRVWLTAYRPPGTDIEVYAKIQNPADTRKHADIEWTRLLMKDESKFLSSGASRFDYREFEFNLPVLQAASILAGEGAALNANNSNTIRYVAPNGSIYNDFGIFALKVVLLSTGHRIVPKIKDIRAIALT